MAYRDLEPTLPGENPSEREILELWLDVAEYGYEHLPASSPWRTVGEKCALGLREDLNLSPPGGDAGIPRSPRRPAQLRIVR